MPICRHGRAAGGLKEITEDIKSLLDRWADVKSITDDMPANVASSKNLLGREDWLAAAIRLSLRE